MFWETESIDSLQSGFGTLLDNEVNLSLINLLKSISI